MPIQSRSHRSGEETLDALNRGYAERLHNGDSFRKCEGTRRVFQERDNARRKYYVKNALKRIKRTVRRETNYRRMEITVGRRLQDIKSWPGRRWRKKRIGRNGTE